MTSYSLVSLRVCLLAITLTCSRLRRSPDLYYFVEKCAKRIFPQNNINVLRGEAAENQIHSQVDAYVAPARAPQHFSGQIEVDSPLLYVVSLYITIMT